MALSKSDSIKLICGEYIISLISCVLKGEKAPGLPEGLSWQFVYELSRLHTVDNIVCSAFERMDSLPDSDILAQFSHRLRASLLREAYQQKETRSLSEGFERSGIRSVLLKGGVIKSLYPDADLRQMGDIDFLVNPGDAAAAHEVITSAGFAQTLSDDSHRAYTKNPSINLELHFSLCDSDLTLVNEFFDSAFDRCVLSHGKKYTYEMTHEDFYIYMIAHLAKHFLTYGAGIRFITDVSVYTSRYSSMDESYIRDTLEKIGLRVFEQNIRHLCDIWYGDAGHSPEFDALTLYIVESGIYGKSTTQVLNGFLRDKTEKSSNASRKARYILREIFPGRKYMVKKYPAVSRCAALLPLFWIVRGVETLLHRKDSVQFRLKGVALSTKNTFNPSSVTERLLH